ncbi:hypothetical protein SDC9_205590 [bioreactor metagenome]|uniref:Uncharacterized protein n=1 Tax=bioreactor metagenome TaxID=1076179 RepID=A0A645JBY1_9ZZZZ
MNSIIIEPVNIISQLNLQMIQTDKYLIFYELCFDDFKSGFGKDIVIIAGFMT